MKIPGYKPEDSSPRVPRKREKVLKRRRYWRQSLVDIDLLKPEYMHGIFCQCGRRVGDSLCEHGLDYV